MASLLGDSTFQSGELRCKRSEFDGGFLTACKTGRRALLQEYIKRDANYPAYAFLFATHTPDEAPPIGVGHGTDLDYSKPRLEFSMSRGTSLLTNMDTHCLSNISLRRVPNIGANI